MRRGSWIAARSGLEGRKYIFLHKGKWGSETQRLQALSFHTRKGKVVLIKYTPRVYPDRVEGGSLPYFSSGKGSDSECSCGREENQDRLVEGGE